MKVNIIDIGNSRGLRLSKTILKKYNIQDMVELILDDEFIIVKPIKDPREGWDEQFQKMAANNDDELLIDDFFEEEDLDP